MIPETLLLFAAGFAGGALNSLAGGGSFITFPALLLVGVPPISANATNTFSSCSGYLSGAWALRRELASHRADLPRYIAVGLLGGIAGAWLLLRTPEALFREAIPWLLLFAAAGGAGIWSIGQIPALAGRLSLFGETGVFRLDASVTMGIESQFRTAMISYLHNGQDALPEILEGLEDAVARGSDHSG